MENLPSIKTILSVCIGLIVVDHQNNTVRLVHLTAQEFFLQDDSRALLKRTQEEMSRACLTYLSYKTLRSGRALSALPDRVQDLPFLKYAAQYWGEHARQTESEVQSELIRFLNHPALIESALEVLNKYIRTNTSSSDSVFGTVPVSLTTVHLAAYWDLQETARLILANDEGKDLIPVADSDSWTPFHWAASNGHVGMVELLIDSGADTEILDDMSWTPLFWAVYKDHVHVSKLLLERGANASRRDCLHMTLLDLAGAPGDEMFELLLRYGASIRELNRHKLSRCSLPRRFWYPHSQETVFLIHKACIRTASLQTDIINLCALLSMIHKGNF